MFFVRNTWRRPKLLGVMTWVSLALVVMIRARAGADFGSWHALSVKFFDDERWTLLGYGQARLRDNSADLFAYQLSPQVVYKASPYLRLGMNYSYLPTKPSGGGEFRDQHRWETEFNPRWPVNDWLTLDLRNRFELRWLEGRSGTNERSRHRPQATIKLKGLGPLDSVFCNDEVFYDYDTHRATVNRLIPLGLNIPVSAPVLFSTYYLLESVQRSGRWDHAHILGTQLSLSF